MFFKLIYFESERVGERQREREREREREKLSSRLHTVRAAPDVRLQPTNRVIII